MQPPGMTKPTSSMVLPYLGTRMGENCTGAFGIFKAEQGACDARAIIITLPKAGTYLMAKVLETLGLVDLEVHLSEMMLSDYRRMTMAEKLAGARLAARDIPLEVSARMILPGQFAVGHLLCTPEARALLAQFVRVVCLREPRHALVSLMRFEARRIAADPLWHAGTRRWAETLGAPARMRGFLAVHGEAFLTFARSMYGWARDADALTCRFEDLLGDNGAPTQRRNIEVVALALGMTAAAGVQALAGALGQRTLTFSGSRTRLEDVWDTSVEAAFRRLRGPEVSELLGYDE
jgi:hypothetical protein